MTLNISSVTTDSTGGGHRQLFRDSSLGNCDMSEDFSNGFTIGFTITRGSIVALYSMMCYWDEKCLEQFWPHIVKHGLSVLLFGSFAVSQKVTFSTAILVVSIMEFLGSTSTYIFNTFPSILTTLKLKLEYHYPLDVYEIQSRLGVFIMMVLGESMIQLLEKSYNTAHTDETYFFLT